MPTTCAQCGKIHATQEELDGKTIEEVLPPKPKGRKAKSEPYRDPD